MRALRLALHLLGWLLTPLVAWAASFLGSTLAAALATESRLPPTASLLAAALGAFASGALALLAWLRIIRRQPSLQHALDVGADGVPEPAAHMIEAMVQHAPHLHGAHESPAPVPPEGGAGPA